MDKIDCKGKEEVKRMMKNIRLRGLFPRVSIISFMIGIVCSAFPAFLFSQPSVRSAGNDAVEVHVNEKTGQFWVTRVTGEQLLFVNTKEATSSTSIYLNGTVFTNNDIRAPQTPPGTAAFPKGTFIVSGDTVIYLTTISKKNNSLEFRQEFIPQLEKDFGFVRIRTSLKNISQQPIEIGVQNLFDIDLPEVNDLQITVGGTIATHERQWIGQGVPDSWSAQSSFSPIVIRGRMNGSGVTPPDRCIAGNWRYNGYLGGAYWDYIPSGLPIESDNAMLLQWDKTSLEPSETKTYATDIGCDIYIKGRLECFADEITLNGTENGYEPDPFRVIVRIENNGEIILRNLQVQLLLPPGISLAPTENAVRNISSPLHPGRTIPVSWNLHADTSFTERTIVFTTILSGLHVSDTCSIDVTIPAIPRYELNTLCREPHHIELTEDGTRYKDNQFVITARVENSGSFPVNSISAVITLPPELQLISGDIFQFITPEPLLPGQIGTATWQVEAVTQLKDKVVSYNVDVFRNPYLDDTCTVEVHLPGIVIPPCVDNGIITKGTSFHAAFTGNTASTVNGEPKPVLYIVADTLTNVEITDHIANNTQSLTIPERGIGSAILSEPLLLARYDEKHNRSFSVKTDQPVSIIGASLVPLHSDASLILPDHALGKEYVVVGYNYARSTSQVEQFVVLSKENNTDVEVTPWTNTSTNIPGGVPFPFSLQEHELFTFQEGTTGQAGGLTGSHIVANKPVAVVAGMESGHIPWTPTNVNYLNPAFDQLLPVELLGTEYIAVPFRSRRNGDTYRIVSSKANTSVTIGTQQYSLPKVGSRLEVRLEKATYIRADKPVIVAQFANSASIDDSTGNEYGDASMVVLPPTDRYASCHTFPTGIGTGIGNTGNRFTASFVNLVVFDGGQQTVTWNGAFIPDTAFHPVPNSTYWYATLKFLPGIQNIGTTDLRGIGVVAYAFEHHDALSYVPGLMVESIPLGVNGTPIPETIEMAVYPNPAQNLVTITMNTENVQTGELFLMDVLGRKVHVLEPELRSIGRNSLSLDVSFVPPGVYFVVFDTQGRRFSRKLFVYP